MLRLSKTLSALLVAVFICVSHSGAQEGPVFRADTRLVVLHASVVDNRGRLVTDLPKSAFRVFENGAEQEIRVFRQEDVPVSMGLVIDNSGSMRDKRREVESAALKLVKASNPEDEVFIVNFNDEFFLDAPFTSDIKKLEEGLTRIDTRGGTAMRDAISASIDYLVEEGKRDKKVILVVTDGDDNASMISLERLVQRAQESEVLIFAIGLLHDEVRRERRRATRALNALTSASGGLAHYPKGVEEVEEIALLVAHEIRNQYIIGYTPSNEQMDGSFRQIRVDVRGPGRPSVRTRTGYYAMAEPQKVQPRPGSASIR